MNITCGYACLPMPRIFFEEGMLNWKDWANRGFGQGDVTWADFYLINGAVIMTGICCAMVGWQLPSFALMFPALQLINAIFFHIGPTIIQKQISPGVITATGLFLPIALLTYIGAYQDGVLTISVAALSFVFGALLMSAPFVFLAIKHHYGIK